MDKKTLIIIDGHSQLYKAYYGIRKLTNSKGFSTNAIYGFLMSLKKVIRELNPDYIAAVFDSKEPSFRTELYAEYKANRQVMPEDLQTQIPVLYDILECLKIRVLRKPGLEADDIIGILSRYADKHNCLTYIITADKDLCQLVNENIKIVRAGKQNEDLVIMSETEVKDKLGIPPNRVIDYLALIGDTSDNIPGVKGIGPKTALKLLEQFDNIDEILTHPEKVENENIRTKIMENMETALLSKKLVTIADDANFNIDFGELTLPSDPHPRLADIYRELEFTSLLKEKGGIGAGSILPSSDTPHAAKPLKSSSGFTQPIYTQLDMFGGIEESVSPESSPDFVIEKVTGEYKCLNDINEIRKYAEHIRSKEWLAFDTETTGINELKDKIVGLSLCCEAGKAVYIPLNHDLLAAEMEQPEIDKVRDILNPVFESDQIKKTAHNLKFDMRILEKYGFKINNAAFDTMVASYVLNPDRQSHSLKSLSVEILNKRMTPISDLIGSGKSSITIDRVDIKKVVPYAAADADITFQLTEFFVSELAKTEKLKTLFNEIEMPLVSVIKDMENTGIKIDISYFKKLGDEFRKKLAEIEKEVHEEASAQFNLNSPKQVSEVLFEKLKLKPLKSGKTGFSTDVQVLEQLSREHTVPKLLLEYRTLEKLRSTYTDAILEIADYQTSRVHTSYNQTIVSTGRLSSSDPNLQNIPVKTDMGRMIRVGFIPSAPGNIFLGADYSQIELRIMASLTEDEALIKAYNEGMDIHRLTASKLYEVLPENVTAQMRDHAKVVNFGILYGMSAHRLSNDLGISRTVAVKFIDDYFSAYKNVKKWMDVTVEFARKHGYVETLMGRRRYIDTINSANMNLRNSAERIAINTPIQGTSADMIKIAMININRRLQKENLKTKMILQVHDELIFDLPAEEKEITSEIVKNEMEKALILKVPVKVEIKYGKNWGECK